MTGWHEWREAPCAEFGVIGDPISHSLSPQMQRAAFASLGLSYDYLAIRVPNEEVAMALDHLRAQGFRGLNVTVPNKEAALQWASEPEPMARRIGAANTLELASGRATNTDAPGFMDVLLDLEVSAGARCLLLGAGGTARAIVVALHNGGYPFAVFNRTESRAQAMLDALEIAAPIVTQIDLAEYDIVANATSAELSGEGLEIRWERARPGTVAIDMYYRPEGTEFIRKARQFGLSAADGRTMLVAQGARSLEWWLGAKAPRSAMLNAIL